MSTLEFPGSPWNGYTKKITVSTENKFPQILSFMYIDQCTLKINWFTLKINQSIKYLHIYQCALLLHISVHSSYQLDV